MTTRVVSWKGFTIVAKKRTAILCNIPPETKWRFYVNGEFWMKLKDLKEGVSLCRKLINFNLS